ncbi:MAG: hypothetical protein OEW90_01740 [Betaproteobacteria bacterium]|nr:hypothetical protein [Betaproteobacteria bacterium]MDH4322841.1 hypothetical protein [Betaproteobacteria bacterium]MDH5211376.1 hypothetical protein [Betaproteobacteria bacterium]
MIVVCDLDGTLADSRHREHHLKKTPADWDAFFSACEQDLPIEQVLRLVHSLWMAGHRIVVVTGRPERLRSQTTIWLDEHGIPAEKLLMRPNESRVRSCDFKRALVHEAVMRNRTPSDIVLALDNSEEDCAAYRSLGILSLHVALPT